MPILILSDIHANWEALEAVLADAKGRYSRILCLGDVAGYGADPNRVIEWTRAHVASIVRGNHDRSSAGIGGLEEYNPAARASAIWTRRALSAENRFYLEHLPRGPLRIEEPAGAFDLAHGSPLDEDDYLVSTSDAGSVRAYLTVPVTFIGHTHIQGGFELTRGGARKIVADGVLQLDPDHYYLINPGSVGQPRDGDPRAAYAVFSPENRTVEYRRANYDIDAAASKIRIAGLPEPLAARLFHGA